MYFFKKDESPDDESTIQNPDIWSLLCWLLAVIQP